jgi:hypothetical protein
MGILSTSILLAIHRTGTGRAFWLGFTLFGWTYLGLSLVPSIESRLLTTKALAYLDTKLPGRSEQPVIYVGVRWTGDQWLREYLPVVCQAAHP